MNRHEFDKAFGGLVAALDLKQKVTKVQTDYFFEEFGGADAHDFAHACRELAMGNPGYLPRIDFFRDNVAAAKEMRMAKQAKPQWQSEVDTQRIFSDWREHEPGFGGLSDWAKGQIIMTAMKRKMDNGEAIYTLRETDTFAFWDEPIPIGQIGAYGHQEDWIRWIEFKDGTKGKDTQWRWIKTKWRQEPKVGVE